MDSNATLSEDNGKSEAARNCSSGCLVEHAQSMAKVESTPTSSTAPNGDEISRSDNVVEGMRTSLVEHSICSSVSNAVATSLENALVSCTFDQPTSSSAEDSGEQTQRSAFRRLTKRSEAACSRKRKCDSDSDATEHEAKSSHDGESAAPGAQTSNTNRESETRNTGRHSEGRSGQDTLMDTDTDSDDWDTHDFIRTGETTRTSQRHDEAQEAEASSSEEGEHYEPVSEAEICRMLEAPPNCSSAHHNITLKLRDRERLFGTCRGRNKISARWNNTEQVHTVRGHREELHGSLALVRRLELHARLTRHEGCVNALNFSESGTLLASGSDDLRVVCWDWQRKRVAFEFTSGHSMNVFQTRFVPGSNDLLLATCARDGQVRLAELSSTGKCMRTRRLVKHRAAAHKLTTFADDSHLILSCGEDAVVYELDLRHERPNRLLTAKSGTQKIALYSIHSNPSNANEICVAGRDAAIRVYDRRFIVTEDAADNVVKRFCPQRIAAQAEQDGSRKKQRHSPMHVTCAVYNYDGTQILGSYNDEDIYLFDCRADYSDEFSHVRQLASSSSASVVSKSTSERVQGASQQWPDSVTQWGAAEQPDRPVDARCTFKGHRNSQTVKGVNFYGPRSQFVVSGSDCGHMLIWDAESTKVVQCLHADQTGAVNVLEPHPFLPILATSGLEHDVKLWFPTASEPSDLTRVTNLDDQLLPSSAHALMLNNLNSRSRESAFAVDVDSEMLWYLMRQLRRSMHSRERGREESESSSDDDDDDDDDQSDHDDDPHTDDDPGAHSTREGARRLQLRPCVTS